MTGYETYPRVGGVTNREGIAAMTPTTSETKDAQLIRELANGAITPEFAETERALARDRYRKRLDEQGRQHGGEAA